MAAEFTAPVRSITKVFDDFYVVPVYQRDYAWEDEEVEQLFHDVCEHAVKGSDYLIGKIITTTTSGAREIIDGQQRLTTLWLMHAALRHVGAGFNMNLDTLNKALRDVTDSPEGGVVSLRRLRMPHNEKGDAVLESILALEPGHDLATPRGANRTERNLVNAFKQLVELLREQFETLDDLDQFKLNLRTRVKVIDVQAPSAEQALLLFETTNNRGRALAPSDLVKNVLFNHADEKQYDAVSEHWQEMVDHLRRAKIDVTPFLRYVALGRYAVKIQDKDVASWYSGRMGGNAAATSAAGNPVTFAAELERLARDVCNIRNGKTPGGEVSSAFGELRALNVKQAVPVLLAAVDWSEGAIEVLAQELADFFFVAAVTRTRGQDIERLLPDWVMTVKRLGSPAPDEARKSLRDPAESATPRAIARASRNTFQERLGQLRYAPTTTRPTNDTRRIRHLLRHLSAQLQGDRWGKLAEIDGFSPQIEHVLAQQPGEAAVVEYGAAVTLDDIHGLGNLALLEEELNKKIGNGRLAEKASSYEASKIRLTRILVACSTDGYTSKVQEDINRVWQVAPGLELTGPWTAACAAARAAAYAALADEVWFS
jgi:hypothetical protein